MLAEVHEQRSEAISPPREEIASPQKARLAMTMYYGIGYLATDLAAALVVLWVSTGHYGVLRVIPGSRSKCRS